MIVSTRCGRPWESALSIACSRIRYVVISASAGMRRSLPSTWSSSVPRPAHTASSSRIAPTSPRSALERQEARDDVTEPLRRLDRGGPAPAARHHGGRGLASDAAADQLCFERGVREPLHRALEDQARRLRVLDVDDLVDLARRLAVSARALVRVRHRVAGHLGELAAHLAQDGLLRRDVGEAGPDARGASLETRELGAEIQVLGECRPRSPRGSRAIVA